MCASKGPASTIYGRSVHNQRIERLWRDLFNGCTRLYYNLFYKLENEGKLDITNAVHLYCLHFVFKPRMNQALDAWRTAWSMHWMRTTGMSPQQMFVLSTTNERLHDVRLLFHIAEFFNAVLWARSFRITFVTLIGLI